MERKEFLLRMGAGAAALPFVSAWDRPAQVCPGTDDLPNILFITTDYQAGEDGPSLGSPFLQMPNLDRLCREGVVLNRHYCTAPICVPSRYTLITGQYPHTHGARDNTSDWVPADSPVLMDQLAQAGYHGTGIGKMHFSPWDRMAGFHQRIIADRKGNDRSDDDRIDDYAVFLRTHGLSRWSYLREQWLADIFGVYDWPFADEFHIDHWVGEQTVRTIESYDRSQPWFIWCSFNGPHNPWDPPARCSDPYKRMAVEDLPAPRLRPGELDGKPLDHTRLRYNYTRAVPDRLDRASPDERPGLIRRLRAGHFGGLTFIDEQIGRILEVLERRGQLHNTIIVYSADHGCELGDHHNIHKGLMYERSARVPMVVWSPSRYRPRRVQGYSAHVDIFPTFLAMAGVGGGSHTASALEGTDLSPVLEGATQGSGEAFIEIRTCTGIVTDQWKLGVHPRDGEGELFHRTEDPDELVNLYDDPGYRQVRRELTDRLIDFHPPLAQEVGRMRPLVFVARDVHTWKPGEHIPAAEAPHHGEKDLRITARMVAHGAWEDGPIITSHVADVHGYALYIRDGRPALGFRRWGRDMVILSPERLPPGVAEVEVRAGRDGELGLLVNGRQVSAGRGDGPLPIQPGRQRVTAAEIHVARSPAWALPIGDYQQGARRSQVVEVSLRLTDPPPAGPGRSDSQPSEEAVVHGDAGADAREPSISTTATDPRPMSGCEKG